MTFWAKLLTVVVLVLSLAFAGMSAVNFAKREDFRGQLVLERTARGEERAKLDAQIAEVTLQFEKRTAALTVANEELRSRSRELDVVTTELAKARNDAREYQSALAKEQAQVSTHATTIQGLSERNTTFVAENEKLRQENLKVIAALSAEQTRANDLETAKALLQREHEGLKVQMADARETIKLNEEIFAQLSERNIEARTLIANMLAVPQIKGRVVTIDPASNLVILNVGKNQGVRKNFDFTLFRDGKFVAKVSVFDTQDDLSAARIVTSNLPIEKGDSAWTRLQ